MPKYTVKHTPILHDGVRYGIGDDIELTEKQASEQGVNLEPAKQSAPKGSKAGDTGDNK